MSILFFLFIFSCVLHQYTNIIAKRKFEAMFDKDLIEAMDNYELVEALDRYEASNRDLPDSLQDLSIDSDEERSTQTCGSLLDFDLRPIGPRRNWRNVLNEQQFQATLRQHREPTPRDNIGDELTRALQRTIRRQIDADNSLSDNSMVNFTFQSDAFSHAFQSTTFTVQEFKENSNRLVDYLGSLAQKLNSNEEFSLDESFTTETTFIKIPTEGSGHRKKLKPGNTAIESLLARKKSIVTIENRDELCCARAIVTMKARIDEDAIPSAVVELFKRI